MQTYTWREGCRIPGNPQIIGETLAHIAAQQGHDFDGLTAADVVQFAADADSPLHPLFEWDDATAAVIHRQDRARAILRNLRVKVVSNGEPRTIIGYVSVRPTETEPSLYVLTSLAVHHEALRRQMLADARTGLNGWMRRYQDLLGVEGVVEMVGRAIEQLDCLVEETELEEMAA